MTVLNVQMYPQYLFSNGQSLCLLYYQAVEIYQQPYTLNAAVIGTTEDLTTQPYATFTDDVSALNYYESDYCSQLMANVNASIGSSYYTSYNATIVAPAVNNLFTMLATVAMSGQYSDLLGLPSLAAVATSGSYNDLTNKPAIPVIASRIFNNTPGRAITTNTGASGFQISASRDASVSYSVSIATTSSLTGSASGYAVLEICATNSATASAWTEVARVSNAQSNTLVVGITLSQTSGGALAAVVPAGYYVRVRSVSASGSPTFTMNSGQEVLL